MNPGMSNGVSQGIPSKIRVWGQGLRFCRQKKGLAVKDVAAAIGMAATDVELWESGNGAPSARILTKLYNVLPLLPKFGHIVPRAAVRAATEVEAAKRRPPPPPRELPPPPELPAPPPIQEEPMHEAAAAPAAPVTPSKPRPATFGAALLAARVARGWTQIEAERRGGITQGGLSRFERGVGMTRASYDAILKLFPELSVDTPLPKARWRVGATSATPTQPKATRKRRAAPSAPAPGSPFDGIGLELARAMADSKEAAAAYEQAMAAAVAAEERKKAAAERAEKLLRDLRDAAGWTEATRP